MAKEDKYEYVSALMDDELSEEGLAALLEDPEAQKKWHEYHMISDYMRHAKCSVGVDLSAGQRIALQEAIEQAVPAEKTVEVPPHTVANSSVFRFFAVAASVCAVAVAVWQIAPQESNPTEPAVAVEKNIAPVGTNQAIVPVSQGVQGATSVGKDVVVPNSALVSDMETQKVAPAILKGKAEDLQDKSASSVEKVQ